MHKLPLLAAPWLLLALAAGDLPAQATAAQAPEQLAQLAPQDQRRIIGETYAAQSGGREISDERLQFYLDQANRASWPLSRIRGHIAQSLAAEAGSAPAEPSITCTSPDDGQASCLTPWHGASRVLEQHSQVVCVEGVNWTSYAGRVNVQGGCGAEFGPGADLGHGRELRCESDGARRECDTGGGTVQLVRQLSGARCVEGVSWGGQPTRVWVDHGCRGVFRVIGAVSTGRVDVTPP